MPLFQGKREGFAFLVTKAIRAGDRARDQKGRRKYPLNKKGQKSQRKHHKTTHTKWQTAKQIKTTKEEGSGGVFSSFSSSSSPSFLISLMIRCVLPLCVCVCFYFIVRSSFCSVLEKLYRIGVCLLTHRCKLKACWLTRFWLWGVLFKY